MNSASRSMIVFMSALMCTWLSASVGAADEAPNPEALDLLEKLEKARTVFKPFTFSGSITSLFRGVDGIEYRKEFRADCEDAKYRIVELGGRGSITVCDGKRLLSSHRGGRATISSIDERSSFILAFDPRSLGLSTGPYNDLTLKESIAYHTAKDIVLSEIPAERLQPGRVGVELTDRFRQRIRFELDYRPPYRVYYYSKTIYKNDGKSLHYRYVTETEYWEDQPDSWMPKKLTMYSFNHRDENKRIEEWLIELKKPEPVVAFEPDTWTIAGRSLP